MNILARPPGWSQMPHDATLLMLSCKDVAGLLKSTFEKGIAFRLTAKGSSMSPFICNGDSLVITPILNKENIAQGDIVAFITPGEGRLIIHRIIKKKGGQYLLKGDNVYHNDGYFKKDHIYGYVNKIVTNSQYLNYQKTIRVLLLFLNNFKMTIALLSRYKILTLICRLTNRVLNEK